MNTPAENKGIRRGAGRPSLYVGKSVRLTVQLTPQAKARGVTLARHFNCSVSDAVETAINQTAARLGIQ